MNTTPEKNPEKNMALMRTAYQALRFGDGRARRRPRARNTGPRE